MMDFNLDTCFLRSDMARALADNPEQLVWVLAELAETVAWEELSNNIENMEVDGAKVAAFYQKFADAAGTQC